jgi:hypothetical protein
MLSDLTYFSMRIRSFSLEFLLITMSTDKNKLGMDRGVNDVYSNTTRSAEKLSTMSTPCESILQSDHSYSTAQTAQSSAMELFAPEAVSAALCPKRTPGYQ